MLEQDASTMTYTIHRYPAELIDFVYVEDAQQITVRPILPQDAELMQTFFRTLSDRSRRDRFHRALRELPASLLNQLTSVDYDTHLALLAEVFVDGTEVIVGEARYVRSEDSLQAEFAMAIAEDWQAKGLGRLLLSHLERRAAAAGSRGAFRPNAPREPCHAGSGAKDRFRDRAGLGRTGYGSTAKAHRRVGRPFACGVTPSSESCNAVVGFEPKCAAHYFLSGSDALRKAMSNPGRAPIWEGG